MLLNSRTGVEGTTAAITVRKMPGDSGAYCIKACYLGLPENCLCDCNTWKMRPIANSGTNMAKRGALGLYDKLSNH